jgi:[ribosomal protein S5]-alanine N-acetyltransferase
MIIFETERLLVRHYEVQDKENFFLLNGSEDVMRYIRPAKSKKECDLFLTETLAAYGQTPSLGRWAVDEKATGNFVGSFAIIPVPEKTELIQLGYALLKDHWGKGYATELTIAGLKHAFAKMELPEIYGLTQKENLISQKVLLKAGFRDAGETKEGEKIVCWFLSRKENWSSPD